MHQHKHYLQLFTIAVVLLMGYTGYSMVLPILTPMLVSTDTLLNPSVTDSVRYLLVGLLIACFPIGQLIGSPILGKLSDRYGRRTTLILTLLPVIPAYLLGGLAITWKKPVLLFVSRFLTGLFEGNVVIATASMADISENSADKTFNFGWVITFSNLGWMVGPFIGAAVINPEIVSWFNFATPFWLASFISFLTLALVMLFFIETLPEHARHPSSKKMQTPSTPQLLHIFVGATFFYLAFTAFFSFLPLLLIKRFGFSPSVIALFEGYTSIPFCFAPLFYKAISNRLSNKRVTQLAGVLLTFSIAFVLISNSTLYLFFSLIPPSFFIAIGTTYAAILVSDAVSPEDQGIALGVNQSCIVFSEALSAIICGVIANISYTSPIIFSAIFALLSALWLSFLRNSKTKNAI
ncbi:MAG: MFS transporter [Verrucomicrobia bacterium]|nr:MFS transporter [Verrucomicrobiota bacterium]NDE63800.1 MFS transporter [Chlamydiota bacterium]